MSLAALSSVITHIRLGQPLPFGVCDAEGMLLLARGQHIDSQAQLDALLARGALADLHGIDTAAALTSASSVFDAAGLAARIEQIVMADRSALPRLWSSCLHQVSQTLLQMPARGFAQALDDAAAPVAALVARDPDLAIFQVLHEGGDPDVAHGARRSLQTAITAHLVAQRLGWEPTDCERAFKVALTMNVSMLALQGQLARQTTAPTAEQRQALQTHPVRSLQMLEAAGVADRDWLTAVLRHHEQEDGSGYPAGCSDVGDIASLARRADQYTAKLASRSGRSAMAADIAGRQMFMQDPGHPMTAALVREFGIYPPGCFVQLASGQSALVVQRGASLTTPVVMCLTDERGRALPVPRRVTAGEGALAVAAVIGQGSVNARLSMDRLAALVTN
ncbi:MAG: HD domain-containing phosphohydrolase [Rubrivivax sp.]